MVEEAAAETTDSSAAPLGTGKNLPRQSFILILPDRKQIDYQVAGGTVNRTLRDGEKVVARESYALAQGCRGEVGNHLVRFQSTTKWLAGEFACQLSAKQPPAGIFRATRTAD